MCTEPFFLRVIPDEVKPQMRQRFFTFFDEADLQVSWTSKSVVAVA